MKKWKIAAIKLCIKLKPRFNTALLDYIGVCIIVFLLSSLLVLISLNLAIFNPLKLALEDFKMTDVYFELMRSGKEKELNKDIVLVDITQLTSRDSIAQAIADIHSCKPKTLMIDLFFERPSFDQKDDIALVSTIEAGCSSEVLSSKLVDYTLTPHAHFRSQVTSFFHDVANFKWGYCNVEQTRPGGCVRQYSLTQKLNDTISYSISYLSACCYMGIKPVEKDTDQRLIIYDDTEFLSINYNQIRAYKNLLKDKLVIVGTMKEEADMHITPIGKLPGMKIQAYSVSTFINHGEITRMSRSSALFMAFLVCLFCAWAGQKIADWFSNLTSYVLKFFYFFLAGFLVWLAFIAFVHFDYEIDLLYPLLGMALVEEGRLHYSSLIKVLCKKTKWKFIQKSIYK